MEQKKILHFEDDTFLTQMYNQKLTEHGYVYKSYNSPGESEEELVSLVLSEKPDLIIMDMIMPGMDGFTAVKCLKSNDQTKDIFILGLSNLGQPEDIEKAKEVSMNDYIINASITPSNLMNVVDTIINDRTNYAPIFGKYLKADDV